MLLNSLDSDQKPNNSLYDITSTTLTTLSKPLIVQLKLFHI